MIYFIALICLLLPTYLIRFSVLGIPTTVLELLIYTTFVCTIILKITNHKSPLDHTRGRQIPNQFLSPITNNRFLFPIILFVVAGIISVVIAPDKREALGLFKAYIFDPILFFFIIIINLNGKKEIPNSKSQILNKSQIPNHPFDKLSFESDPEGSPLRVEDRTSKSQINSNFQNPKPKNSLEIGNWKLEILIKSLILSGILVAIQAIWQKITGQVTSDGRVVGIFGYSPNYLALYLVPISMLSFGMIWQKKNKIAYVILFLIIMTGIILTGSRIAVAAALIAISAFFIIYYWQKIKQNINLKILLYCYIAILLVGGFWLARPNWNATASSGRISSSNNIRWEIWKTTIKDIVPTNPNWLLGVGISNYQNYFTKLTNNRVNFPQWIAPMAITPHNLFLTIWLNLGLLGLVSFVWLLILFFRSNKNLYSTILCVAMIAILIQGLVDTPYWKNDLALIFWIFLALKYNFDIIELTRRI